jgi:hypothetical protein
VNKAGIPSYVNGGPVKNLFKYIQSKSEKIPLISCSKMGVEVNIYTSRQMGGG